MKGMSMETIGAAMQRLLTLRAFFSIRSLLAKPCGMDWGIRPIATAAGVAVVSLLTIAPLLAGDHGQEVWLVNTRPAPHCGDLEAGVAQIAFWRLDAESLCRWHAADARAFRESGAASAPTTVYFHGGRTDESTAVEHAWCLYLRMKQCAAGRPFRLVVWAWPADRMARRARLDMQMEAAQTDPDAYYLARCLAELKPGMPVGLVGYSFGARIIGGALELLSGGQVACRSLSPEALALWSSGPRPVRVMYVAPAVNADGLMPGRGAGIALTQVERILVAQNSCDRALRWYRRLYGRRGPEAMGHVGPVCCLAPGSGCEKIEVADVSCAVGKRHDWHLYQAAPAIVERLAWYTFLAP